MKRAILILILCAVFLSACGNAAETAERSVSVGTSAVSQTTTAVTVSAVTSAKEEKDTSEATTTTFKTSSQTVSETSKPTNITVLRPRNQIRQVIREIPVRDRTILHRIITVRKITISLCKMIRSQITRRPIITGAITERNRITIRRLRLQLQSLR